MPHCRTFHEFWPFYISQHREAGTRYFHFVGSGLALLSILAGIFFDLKLILLAPVAGYGFAWVSHFAIEKNRPATFQYPLWSLLADYKMFYLMCRGRMAAEVKTSLTRSRG